MITEQVEASKSSGERFRRRFLVDISTSWNLVGTNAMGILRTERELARRLLTDPALHSIPIVFSGETIYVVNLDDALAILATPKPAAHHPNDGTSTPSPIPSSAPAAIASKRAKIYRFGLRYLSRAAWALLRLTPDRSRSDLLMSLRHGKKALRSLLSPNPSPAPQLSNGETRPAPSPNRMPNVSLILHLSERDVIWTCGLYAHLVPLRRIAEEKQRRGFSVASICYDLIRVRNPQWNPRDMSSDIFVANTADLLDCSDAIFCISDYVLADLAKFATEIGRSAPPLRRITLGANIASQEHEVQNQALRFRGRFALAVGTVEPRKNYELLLHIWQRIFPSDGPEMNLVIVGKEGYQAEKNANEVRSAAGLNTRIHWLQDISDSELQQLYREAHVFLCPSLQEGWGLPVTEALSFGCPVITSDRGALPEAGQGLSTIISPLDEAAWQAAVSQAMQDPRPNRQAISVPTWEDAAASLGSELNAIFSSEGFNEGSAAQQPFNA